MFKKGIGVASPALVVAVAGVAASAAAPGARHAVGVASGSFQPHVDYASGSGTTGVQVADLNGDGRLDVVAANALENTVSVFLGPGSGTLGAPTKFATAALPKAITISDLNRDGRLDLAVAARNGNCVSV